MTATQALSEGILKILSWAYLKYYHLLGRQTVSVSCGYRQKILHI